MTKIGSYVLAQKKNKINCISLIIQYSNQMFDNEEQIVNADVESYFNFRNNIRAQSSYVLTTVQKSHLIIPFNKDQVMFRYNHGIYISGNAV